MWLWIWLGFVLFLLMVPFAYGWGSRRWGEPGADAEELPATPRTATGPGTPAVREASLLAQRGGLRLDARREPRAERAVDVEPLTAWRWLPEVLWLSALVLLAWVVLAVTVG